MGSDSGLVAAYALNGKGGGTRLGWDDVRLWRGDEGFLWVHLDLTDPVAQHWVSGESGLTEVVAEALLADETRPRSSFMKEGLLVMLRGVNTNPGAEPEDMVALRIWVEDRRVVTTRRRRLLSIMDVGESIDKNDGPMTPGELLVTLSDCLVERMAVVIDEIDEHVDRLESDVVESENPRLRHELADLRTQVIALRRYLSPQREAMVRLSQERNQWLSDVNQVHLREVSDRIIRYVEDLDAVRDRAAVVQEELASRLSEQLNKRMYMLSMVTAVFLPLGFLTGLLGVNVGGIPGSDNVFGFAWVIGLVVALVVLQVWVFKRQRRF